MEKIVTLEGEINISQATKEKDEVTLILLLKKNYEDANKEVRQWKSTAIALKQELQEKNK
jgi:hypothetical protein